ncbi:MAG: hypothetical protein UZ07_CHB004002143 [Chlorobi bacterium OLB7]|nr:MAG: hypothetical protein UZ07_CHB004002143 [Chlorobi bacterium OLB7]
MTIRTTLLLLLSTVMVASAQEAITFEQLAERMDPYFAPELVQDVRDALPQAPYDVWGYDVGDFTGDSAYDFAVCFRLRADNKRRIQVYFFIDEEGIMQLVKQSTVGFVELPIEVGVTISKGTASIARKQSPTEWSIEGYRYRDGVIMLVDDFTTTQRGNTTHEEYRNYQTLEGNDRYRNTNTGEAIFETGFMTIPSYSRGRDVSSGYQANSTTQMSRFVQSGSYYWTGAQDLSFNVRSAHDNDFLYFNIFCHDDHVVVNPPKENDTAVDRLEIWLDMYTLGDRLRVGKRSRDFRTKTDTNIYAFEVGLGDLLDKPATVQPRTSNYLDPEQTAAAKRIKAVAAKADSGYTVKIRIPWAFLGFAERPAADSLLTEFGATVVIHDMDNIYRPEEITAMASSEKFEDAKPATFGALVLVPDNRHYGDAENIFLGEVKERLEEVGF